MSERRRSWVQAFFEEHGRPPTLEDLQASLRKLGIEEQQLPDGQRGYHRHQFEALWKRYGIE